VFGRVFFEPVVCMCTVRRAAARRTVHTHTHTHHWFKNYAAKHRLSTRQTSVNQTNFGQVQLYTT